MAEAGTERLIHEILRRNKYCTLATASLDGKPEAAMMQYAEDDDNNLYLYAFTDARKYPNISQNPRGSVVLFDQPDYVQMDGEIVELSGEAAGVARELLIEKHGNKENYHGDPRCRYFRFVPVWLRVRLDPDFPARYAVVVRDQS